MFPTLAALAGGGYALSDLGSRYDAGQSVGQSVGGTLADLSGFNGVYKDFTDEDVTGGGPLGLTLQHEVRRRRVRPVHYG
jgi:hypothetical protein